MVQFLILILFFKLSAPAAFAQYTPVNSNLSSSATAGFNDMLNKQKAFAIEQAEIVQRNQMQAAKGQRNQSILMMIGGLCSSLMSGGQKPKEIKTLAQDIEDQAYEQLAEGDPQYGENWDRGDALAAGQATNAELAANCSNYINSEGKLGAWGQYAVTQLREFPEQFQRKNYSDSPVWCPNYKNLDPSQREIVWVSVLAANASPESTCNPAARGKGSNGTALGLHQVWNDMEPDTCRYASDLMQPNQNIKCAIARLAMELGSRDTLRTTTNKTYWGTFRVDPASIDKGAAQKTLSLLRKIPLCQPPSIVTTGKSGPLFTN